MTRPPRPHPRSPSRSLPPHAPSSPHPPPFASAPAAIPKPARKRRWIIGVLIWLGCMLVLFPAWIATAYFLGSTERNAAGVALNVVLTIFIACVGLPIMHRGTYRWLWHIEQQRLAGTLPLDMPAYGSEPTLPAPRIAWPLGMRIRHLLIHLSGSVALIYLFLPYANQVAIQRFIVQYSGGRSSAGALNAFVFAYLPLAVVLGLVMLLTWRQEQGNTD